LTVRAHDAPLPEGTRINVRYGANQRGEAFVIGEPTTPQAVHCDEDTTPGGGPSDSRDTGSSGAGGSPGTAEVWAVHCLLYTQGPARLDVDASGYQPIKDMALDIPKGCELPIVATLEPLKPREDK